MAPVHPPPPAPLPSRPSAPMDPYSTLGLNHDASQAQIKSAYRKLALRYHPDRQQASPPMPTGPTASHCAHTPSSGGAEAAPPAHEAREAASKFAAIAAAYAILSDPEKKGHYDHLYKFGAFDAGNDHSHGAGGTSGGQAHNIGGAPKTNNYRYTEDYSGGYYRKDYTPPANPPPCQHQQRAAAAAAAAWAQQFQTMQRQDSFFDDLIYSPKNSMKGGENAKDSSAATAKENAAPPRKTKPGIGFSLAPLGKHLSVHVPSKNEVMANMARGEPSHLFGTRVTYSQQTTSGTLPCGVDTTCGDESALKEKKVVCQTTRIAGGRKRMVKRTAHLRPDGTKEVVIEEEGVVLRRYVEENPNKAHGANNNLSEEGSNDVRDDAATGETDGEGGGGLQRGGKFTLLGLFRSCLAPCVPITG